jgi:3-oxoacyl-[acyl-carrier protein] reductase
MRSSSWRQGAKITLSYQSNKSGAKKVRAKILAAGGSAIAVHADVRRPADILSLVKRSVEEFGPIDILVNNAGSLVERMRILEMNSERWDEVLNLNLRSAVLCAQSVAASMVERKKGAIINVVFNRRTQRRRPGSRRLFRGKGRFNRIH